MTAPAFPALPLTEVALPEGVQRFLDVLGETQAHNHEAVARCFGVRSASSSPAMDVLGSYIARSSELMPELGIDDAIEAHDDENVRRRRLLLESMARNDRVARLLQSLGFAHQTPFILPGQLAAICAGGGAYGPAKGWSSAACMQLGYEAVQWLIGNPLRDDLTSLNGSVQVWHNNSFAWTPWFAGIIGDDMWLMYDALQGRLLALAITQFD